MKRSYNERSSDSPPAMEHEHSTNGSKMNGVITSLEKDMDHVIVVGAGPAGLMLASNLVRFGVKTRILDDRADKTSTGRADGLQPKTIETFKQLGLAGSLLQKGVRIYDICFWNSSATESLRRTARDIHYPPDLVDVVDPFILLVHQGMVEDVFLEDLKARGVEVQRNSPFVTYSKSESPDKSLVNVEFTNLKTGKNEIIASQFLIGCDGAHSKVRKAMPGAEMVGGASTSAWGVLDGVIETDFPDLWSKVVISSETEGTILCIPRERNMTRLYIELHPNTAATESKEDSTQDFVMERAKAIMKPFKLSWKSVEWFGVYKVGQRVAKYFSDRTENVFISGDAAHTHSPKAAQGMNTSMHDTFNLAWKLNLSIRGLALPSLLSTYSLERKKIAQDLITFDYDHANAFSAGDPKALAVNFEQNIRFISGVGAEYDGDILNIPESSPNGDLRAGSLLSPAKVERYIDANPVDLQLDIPMLGQFRIFFFVSDVKAAAGFLSTVCEEVASSRTVLGRVSAVAEKSYAELPTPYTESDEFTQPRRYTAVSKVFTFALVTTMAKNDVEISDLPPVLQDSRWTFYLDNIMEPKSCTEKWLGKLGQREAVIVNIRPDGYVGSTGRWDVGSSGAGSEAAKWLDEYYGAFLQG